MLLILRSAALKLRSASTLLRVDAVSNGHNKEETEKSLWHATATVEEEKRKKGTQVYLLSRPWSLCGLVLCVCIWMPSRSLSLWMLDLQDWMDLLQRGPMSKQN